MCVTDAPGLATAGTGDVLTGILAAFLAKGIEPRLAAAAAATAHGLAARSRGDQAGMIASDVIARTPRQPATATVTSANAAISSPSTGSRQRSMTE